MGEAAVAVVVVAGFAELVEGLFPLVAAGFVVARALVRVEEPAVEALRLE